MGEKMRKLSKILESDDQLKKAVLATLPHKEGYIPLEIMRCLDDPDQNPEVRTMLQNVIERNTPDADCEVTEAGYYREVLAKFIAACKKAEIELGENGR